MTNAQHIAKFIADNGPKSVLIHTIPTTGLWLVGLPLEQNYWKFLLMDPDKTTYRLVGKRVTDTERLGLWQELVKLGVETKMREIKARLKKV
ncbi:MAG TPA: hypothetical protein VJG67_00905 [Candidatus Paceibacterota bacterium]